MVMRDTSGAGRGNDGRNQKGDRERISGDPLGIPPTSLLIAYAPVRTRDWHRLCWAIDGRMARIVLGAREGSVAAIRLAWWEEALTAEGTGGAAQGRGEPFIDAWRAHREAIDGALVHRLAAAWRMLLDPAPMTEHDWRGFGEGRGALFELIGGGSADRALGPEAVWALWDLARIDPDRQRAEGAFAAAIAAAEGMGHQHARGLVRPLRLAYRMALDDIRARRVPEARFTPRAWLRMALRALTR